MGIARHISLFSPNLNRSVESGGRHLPTVCMLALSHNKGIPYLFHSLAELKEQREDWHLDILGDGSARPQYDNLAAEPELVDIIAFHGFRLKSELAESMRQADLFVLSRFRESSPCVLIEAMASRRPFVSTLTGGIPEIVDETDGILAPLGDVVRLTEALAQTTESLDKFGHRGICQRAQQYCPESAGRFLHSIYMECVLI